MQPWDMTTPTHRQFNPLYIARRAAAFIDEAAETLRRREAGSPGDAWMRSSLLPDYFQGGFHYQTDGWVAPSVHAMGSTAPVEGRAARCTDLA